jgi:hypothetical protein
MVQFTAVGGSNVDPVKTTLLPSECIGDEVMIDGVVSSDASAAVTVGGITVTSSMLFKLLRSVPFTVAFAITRYLPGDVYECDTVYSLPVKSVALPVTPSPKLNTIFEGVPPVIKA